GHDEEEHLSAGAVSLKSVIIQIAMLDIIFSLDSVIAAVGMADQLYVMFTAVIISVCVMLVFAESVSRFVAANPTIKMLALSFLILIGFMLVVEGAGPHFNKGYIYFAMTFALAVEFLNMRMRTVADRKPSKPAEDGG
ncbi:MAG: TerC family protein, partial [Pirellulaceae bacterium]|nr:TerC family protein [Pirellulaceae bacterium]